MYSRFNTLQNVWSANEQQLWLSGGGVECDSGSLKAGVPANSTTSAKLLKVKGSGAEARAEGPFLRWQNRSGEAAKSAERERRPQPPPSAGKREVPTSSSSDSAGAESSVTAAKPPQG